MIEKCILHKPDNRFFFRSWKDFSEFRTFSYILCWWFFVLSLSLFSIFIAFCGCIHFAKTGDLSSLDISLEWFMLCLETFCCLVRFAGCCEMSVTYCFSSQVIMLKHLWFILMSIVVIKIVPRFCSR